MTMPITIKTKAEWHCRLRPKDLRRLAPSAASIPRECAARRIQPRCGESVLSVYDSYACRESHWGARPVALACAHHLRGAVNPFFETSGSPHMASSAKRANCS